MDRKCKVCGSDDINIESSSIIWGISSFCSASCHHSSMRSSAFFYLLAGAVSTLLNVLLVNYLVLELFLIPLTLYLFDSAAIKFSLAYPKNQESTPQVHDELTTQLHDESTTEPFDEFTIRLELLNEERKAVQASSLQHIQNSATSSTTSDPDPQGFFGLTDGKLKKISYD